MRAGRLRHRVTFQRKSKTLNAYGESLIVWEDFAVGVPADVAAISGRERIAAGQNLATTTVRIWIRYREGITSDMRIVHDGTIYAIEAILPDKGRREKIEILCTLGHADG